MTQTQMRSRRGMSLIEGMISMAVLVIGILGALQGILFASAQNGVAARLSRADSMAAELRLGLEMQGRARLLASGGAIGSATNCVPVTTPGTLGPLTDGLVGSTITGACILDVDAYDDAQTNVSLKITPAYDLVTDYKAGGSVAGSGAYRRVVVYQPTSAAATVAVIVSTRDTNRRIFVTQFLGLYDNTATTGNGTGVDL